MTEHPIECPSRVTSSAFAATSASRKSSARRCILRPKFGFSDSRRLIVHDRFSAKLFRGKCDAASLRPKFLAERLKSNLTPLPLM